MFRLGPSARVALLVLMGVLLFAAWWTGDPPATGSGGCCAQARLANGWCETHERGFVAGLEIRSRVLFDALDAHGHTLDPTVMECANCTALMRSGGFCEACRFGWVGGQAYMTRLTYHLALGHPSNADARCAACRGDSARVGWCEACGRGWAGNVVFERRDDQADAAREFRRLEAVIATSARCETCSLVQLVDGRCPYCDITYAGGLALAGQDR